MVSTADLFATIADVVSGKVPSPESGGTDSFSFLPLLRNAEASDRPHAVLRDAKGRQALLFGDWKYIDDVLPDGEVITGTDSRMLFNLNTDPGETTDVVTDNPQVVERARKLLAEIRNRPSSRTIPL